jgi:DNA ligase (NAD+)
MTAITFYTLIENKIKTNDKEAAKALLSKACEDYYGGGNSDLLDPEFDKLQKLFIKTFRENFNTVQTKGEINAAHDWPLLATWLNKAANLTELDDWYYKQLAKLKNKKSSLDLRLAASPKWDGMSLLITYDELGKVVKVISRGDDDGQGVDYTDLFRDEVHFNIAPFNIPFGIKYEVVMSWEDLNQLNIDGDDNLKNPRNTVPGIIRSANQSRRKYLTLVPLDYEYENIFETREQRIDNLFEMFGVDFEKNPYDHGSNFLGNFGKYTPLAFQLIDNQADFENIYNNTLALRSDEEFDFMIDGVVLEFINPNVIDELGGVKSDCSNHSIAVKFPCLVGRTEVISIDFDLGNSGRITPVVNYKPITLDGRTFSRTSLANFARFDKLQLAVGSPIIVEIRGDVIGWVDRDNTRDDPEGAIPIQEPDGLDFTYNELGIRVFGLSEAPLAGRVERMLTTMGIKGIKYETLDKLVNAGLLVSIYCIFELSKKDIIDADIPGIGESIAEKIYTAIKDKKAKGIYDWEILASIGISGVGKRLSKDALSVCTLHELIAIEVQPVKRKEEILQHLNSLDNIGDERLNILFTGINKYFDDIVNLLTLLDVIVSATLQSKDTSEKYKIVITGDLDNWEREEFKDYLESLGHHVVGSVSKKTDYLITNTPSSGTGKNKKAQELNIPIISESEAIQLLSLKVPNRKKTINNSIQEGVLEEGL